MRRRVTLDRFLSWCVRCGRYASGAAKKRAQRAQWRCNSNTLLKRAGALCRDGDLPAEVAAEVSWVGE